MIFTMDAEISGGSPQFTLICISTGGPTTTVTWTRDSETVSGGMSVLNDMVTAQYIHTLIVADRLGGYYQCNVSNNKPSNDTAELTIETSNHNTPSSVPFLYAIIVRVLFPSRTLDDFPLSLHLLPHGW